MFRDAATRADVELPMNADQRDMVRQAIVKEIKAWGQQITEAPRDQWPREVREAVWEERKDIEEREDQEVPIGLPMPDRTVSCNVQINRWTNKGTVWAEVRGPFEWEGERPELPCRS